MVQPLPALPSMTFDYPDGDGANRSTPDYIEHIDEVQILKRLIDTDIDPCELLTKIEDIKSKALPANIWEWVNTPNFDWSAAEKKLVDVLAKQIVIEIDQAIIKDLTETTVTEIVLKQQEAEAKLQYLPRNSFYYSERDGPYE